MRVQWASGAEAAVPAVSLCPAQGKRQQVTFLRPETVEGRAIDLQFALQIEQLRMQQQANDAAIARALPPPLQLPKHCISNVIGNQVFTSCF